MNTKLIVALIALTTVLTLSLPSLAELLHESVAATGNENSSTSLFSNKPEVERPCDLEILKITGKSYKVEEELRELTETGRETSGFFKTDTGGMLELSLASGAMAVIYPETELKIFSNHNAGVIDIVILNGEIEFLTSKQGGKKIRVLADGLCTNPDSANFRIVFNPAVDSGKIAVRSGMIRVTSEKEPNRYFSLPTLFCLHFSEGKLQIPHRAETKEYTWKLNQ